MDMYITEKEAGKTVREIARQCLGFSSAQLKRMKFTDGGITVNGASVTVRYVTRIGDKLSFFTEDTEADVSPYITPSPIPLSVLYEDSEITVVDKPSDMPAHPSLGHASDTVANALAYRYREKPYVFRPVNRLDRDTSGVMLTANTRLAAFRMFRAMQSGEIQKTYIAVTDGVPAVPAGEIRLPIRRAADSIMLRETCDSTDAGAKEACTRYRTLGQTATHSVLCCEPLTGRTHQIRVHLRAIGCPITGDSLYGDASAEISRHALHAAVTEFPHPGTEERMRVLSPLPRDMRALIDTLFQADAEKIYKEMRTL